MPKDPQVSRSGVGKPRSKTLRTKMKVPEYEEDGDQGGSEWSVEDLKYSYHQKELRDFVCQDPVMKILKLKRIAEPKDPVTAPAVVTNKLDAVTVTIKLLKETGMTPGSFDTDDLFDLDLTVIQTTSRDLFEKLKILVDEMPQIADPVSSPQIDVMDNLTVSSHYASAAEDGSDTSSEPRRMSLGSSGAAMLEAKSKIRRPSPARSGSQPKGSTPTDQATTTSSSDRSAGTAEPQNAGSRDVDMESIRSSDRGSNWEYDPDDIDFPAPAQAAVATAASGSTGSTMIQRIGISTISDLKKFSGKDPDEDRARAWISKVKSAFMRDQASDEEKCLTFADLFAGSAKNWYRQLSRSTRNKWSYLLRSFQIQYCGLGVSVARQYYHARRRSDESPLDYLYRLNVAGLRARLKIKDGSTKDRCEHVDHLIETPEDPDLADRLTLLRLSDADDLEEVLRARDRAKSRSDSSDGSDGSDSEMDSHRRIYLAANQEVTPKEESETIMPDPGHQDTGSMNHTYQEHRSKIQSDGFNRNRCSHCGSKKHSNIGCWRRVTCTKCGKRGHPADHCLFVCSGCGELHDMGKCPIEEIYNQIHQWFNPTKHMGMLPEAAEKMLN
ncbi:hypothetical protein PHMEG_00032158 [Phytophthora megakarya]|uniref:CCHC-type domain-containing protein n=1 Tax=Phytophthora megakarya TaxID=4795 RepID=A0A225UWY9_9STRA|nr:hypothetical protein PHMEG_00032158 [Phytophthora megakarya]